MESINNLKPTDLISKEIYKNRSFIVKNGLVKFYQKSKYLSKVWEIYKLQFEETYNLFSIYNITAPIPKEEYILRPFNFILDSLKYNFNRFYINRELITKRRKFEFANGKSIWINDIRFGKKTKHYNIRESEVISLINELFLISNMITKFLTQYFQIKYSVTDRQLQERINNRRKASSKKIDDPVLIIYNNIISVMRVDEKISVRKACKFIFDDALKNSANKNYAVHYSDGDFEAFYTKFLSFYNNNIEKYPTEYLIIEAHKQKKS